MKYITLFVAIVAIAFAAPLHAEINKEKRAEIDTLIRLTGLEKLMNQMKDQMLSSIKTNNPKIPPEILKRLSAKLEVRDVLEKIVPIYDKYYTLEDLRAVNAFYSSPAGQKVLSSLPQVMQESMAVGQEWGQKAGQEIAAEITAEAGTKSP